MGVFGRPNPERTIVKEYGRDVFLIAGNVLVAPIVGLLGLRIGLRSEVDVLDRMEKDALRMADDGYQVVDADRCAVPWLARLGLAERASYYRVTYRRRDPAPSRAPSA